MATLARYEVDAVDSAGNLLTGSLSVEVRKESDNTLATLKPNRDGSGTLANPFTITDGHVGFHTAGGAFKITMTQGAFSKVLRYVAIGTAAESDALLGTLASTTEVLTGTDNAKNVTPDAVAALWEKAADVASAGTVSLGEGGLFHITGTTTITDIDFATAKDGRHAILIFDGILTLTNGANLKLPGAANIVTAAGDRALVVQDNGDAVYVLHYQRAATPPIDPASATAQGIVELATSAETITGTDTVRAVTPADLRAAVPWVSLGAPSTPAAVGTLDFTSLSAYRALHFRGFLRPVTNTVALQMRVSISAAFDTGANYDYADNWGVHSGSHGSNTGVSADHGEVANNIGNSTGLGIFFDLYVFELNKGRNCMIVGSAGTEGSAPIGAWTAAIFHKGTSARDGVRFFFSSGNIAEGWVQGEGLVG